MPAAENLRVLVAIASFGERNLHHLKEIIQRYKSMAMAVDIIVVSEAPKDLPPSVSVAIGLPSNNPWSLPFAHKPLFAERVDQYDLFIYSEDDIGVTEANLRAFLSATQVLRKDEIAGFLRYEKDAAGNLWMPDAHSMYRWDTGSVVDRGGQLFAQYTNEHAAFYVLTQAQLRHAIASGGFLREPYEAKYDMLCAAATDPYTSCGFRKMVRVSDLKDFLIHHMSDRYAGQMGLPLSSFEEQLGTLAAIHDGVHPATTLCEVESKIPRREWSKSLYEKPHETLMAAVPLNARTVLSIGCGWGATEAELKQRGAEVVALALDSVIGAAAAKRGIQTVYGGLDDCLRSLGNQTYDCVLITNLLHLQQDPAGLFDRCARFVRAGGTLVVDSPNFHQLAILAKRALGNDAFKRLRSFAESGVSTFGPGILSRSAAKAGMAAEVRWYDHSLPKSFGLKSFPVHFGRLTANGWVFRATRGLAPR